MSQAALQWNYDDATIAAMENHAPDAHYLLKVSAADFSNAGIAINEYVANSVQSICMLHAEPHAPSETSRRPEVRVTINLSTRELECVDNGKGMTAEEMKHVFRPGGTGHAADALDGGVGPGGYDQPGAARTDSFSTFLFSAYGHGAKGAAAGLVRGEDGIASEGSIRVRSRPAEDAGVTGAMRNFAHMTKMRALSRHDDAWKTSVEPHEMEVGERALVGEPTWGPRFTRVLVNGVSEKLCAKLRESEDERLKLVAQLHELYHPLLEGGIDNIEWTKPPSGVTLALRVVFDFGVARERELYVLDGCTRGPTDLGARAIVRGIDGEHPTIAQLLARNASCVASYAEGQGAAARAAQAAWGDSLTLHCIVTLALPDGGGSIQAGLILVYLPESYEDDEELLPRERDFGESAGLFPVVNGQRLLTQQPIKPRFLREPPRARGKAAAQLPEGALGRVVGLICFGNTLPFLVALDKAKTSFQPLFAQMVERLDSAQIPTKVSWRQPAAHSAVAVDSRLRTRAATGAPLTLEQLVKDKWLPDMVNRDPGVRVSDEESAAATQMTVAEATTAAAPRRARAPPPRPEELSSNCWSFNALTFMGKALDVRKPDDLYVQYRSSDGRRLAPEVGKVFAFVCRGAKPDRSTTQPGLFEALVSRVTSDETNGDYEFVGLKRIRGKEWLDLPSTKVDEARAETPCALELWLYPRDKCAPCDLTLATELDEKQTHVGVSARGRAGAIGDKLKQLKLPLKVWLAPIGCAESTALRTWTNVTQHGGIRDADGRRVPWRVADPHTAGVWHFLLPRGLAPGAYTLCVATPPRFFQALEATLQIIVPQRAPAIVSGFWLTGATAPCAQMGGALPALALVVTDEHGFVVDPPASLLIDETKCLPFAGGVALAHEMPLERSAPGAASEVDQAELHHFAHHCKMPLSKETVVVVRLQLRLKRTAGFKLGSGSGDGAQLQLQLALGGAGAAGRGLTLVQPPPLELRAGAPARFEAAADDDGAHEEVLLPGGWTRERALVALDAFSNCCIHWTAGLPLGAAVARSAGVAADAVGRLEVKMGGAHAGRLLLPALNVTGAFGSDATLALALDTPGAGALELELRWPIAARALAFGCGDLPADAEQVLHIAHGVVHHRLILSAPAGQLPAGQLAVSVHHVDAAVDGGDALALGARDAAFGSSQVAVSLAVGSCVQLRLARGSALVPAGLIVAPRAVGAITVFTAECYGAVAEIEIRCVAGPAARTVLALAAAEPVTAGVSFTLRAELVDSSGSRSAAPAGLNFAQLGVDIVPVAGAGPSAPREMLRPAWRVTARTGGVIATCSITHNKAGSYTAKPRWADSSGLAGLASSGSERFSVSAGESASLRLSLSGCASDAGGCYEAAHGAKLTMRAELFDVHDNPVNAADVGTGEFELTAVGVQFAKGSSPLLVKSGAPRAEWPALRPRLVDQGAPLPATVTLGVHWRKDNSSSRAHSAQLTLKLRPTGTEIRSLRTTSPAGGRIDARPGAVFEVAAELLLDNGAVCTSQVGQLKAGLRLRPTSESAVAFGLGARSGAVARPRPGSSDGGTMVLTTKAQAVAGTSTWQLSANGVLPIDIHVVVHADALQEDAQQQQQPEPDAQHEPQHERPSASAAAQPALAPLRLEGAATPSGGKRGRVDQLESDERTRRAPRQRREGADASPFAARGTPECGVDSGCAGPSAAFDEAAIYDLDEPTPAEIDLDKPTPAEIRAAIDQAEHEEQAARAVVDELTAELAEVERRLRAAREAHAACADKLSELRGEYDCAAAACAQSDESD